MIEFILQKADYSPSVRAAMAERSVYEEREANQPEFVNRMMSGSQAKTAFALRLNAEKLIKENGIECCVFVTLTLGNYDGAGLFRGVKSADEASRRWNNLCRRVLTDLFETFIVVSERHKSGSIHFHVLAGTPRAARRTDGV